MVEMAREVAVRAAVGAAMVVVEATVAARVGCDILESVGVAPVEAVGGVAAETVVVRAVAAMAAAMVAAGAAGAVAAAAAARSRYRRLS